ncbi:MAG: hypothetical protein K0S30_1524 [Clostridia bacterium]|nr:hypothetical protein [Clostridia bacterium]
MILKVIAGVILMICIGSILNTYSKAQKRYRHYQQKAVIKSLFAEESRDRYLRLFEVLPVIIIMGVLFASILFDYYNERMLLGLTVIYLSMYYINQYLPNDNWIIYNEGLMSSRGRAPIQWENIHSYRFMSRKAKEVLIISYKGRGLITQRSDFSIGLEQRQRIEKILKDRVVGG